MRDPDRGGRTGRGAERRSRLSGKGREVQARASYRGSREPAGRAGRREGRRRSYSPWWSQPCREAGTDTRDRRGRQERQTGVSGVGVPPGLPVLPPATLSTHVQPTLPPSLSSRSRLLALCLDHYPRRPQPPSPLLPLTRAHSHSLAHHPPAHTSSATTASLATLAPDLSSVSASLGLCPSLWPSQICLALNLTPTPWRWAPGWLVQLSSSPQLSSASPQRARSGPRPASHPALLPQTPLPNLLPSPQTPAPCTCLPHPPDTPSP